MFALLAVFATSMGFQYDDWKQSILCLVSGDLPSAGTVCDLMGQWVTTYETLENAAKQQPNFEAWKEANKYINPNNAFRSIVIGRPGSVESDLAKIDSGYVLSVYVYGDWTNTPIDLNKLGRRCVVSITHLTGSATTLSDPKPVIEKLVKLQESASKNKVSAKQFSELSKQVMQEYVTVPKTAADDAKVIKLVCNEDLSKKVDHLDLVSGDFAMEGSGCKVPSLGFESSATLSYTDAQKLQADWCLDSGSVLMLHQGLLPDGDENKNKPYFKCSNYGVVLPSSSTTTYAIDIKFYQDKIGFSVGGSEEQSLQYSWYTGTLSLLAGSLITEVVVEPVPGIPVVPDIPVVTTPKTFPVSLSVDSSVTEPLDISLNFSIQSRTDLPGTILPTVSAAVGGSSYAGYMTEWPLYLSTLTEGVQQGMSVNILDPDATISFTGSNWDKVTLNLIAEAKKAADVTVTGTQPTTVTLNKHSIDERSAGEGRNDPDAQNKADNPLDPLDPSGLSPGAIVGIVIAVIAVVAGVGAAYWFIIRPRMMTDMEDEPANA